MKRWLILVTTLFFLGSMATAFAESADADGSLETKKPTIALAALIDNSGYTQKANMFDDIFSKLKAKFSILKDVTLASGANINDGLKKSSGVTDISLLDKSELLDYGKTNGFNYIVIPEISTVSILHTVGWQEVYKATIPLKLKIFSVNTGKYIYLNTITETGKNKNSGGLFMKPSTTAAVKDGVELIIKRLDIELEPALIQISGANRDK